MMLQKRTGWLGTIISVGLLLLSFGIIYWQLYRRDLNQVVAMNTTSTAQGNEQSGGTVNAYYAGSLPYQQRLAAKLADITRGNIYANDNEVLASDQLLEDGGKLRLYPDSTFASVVGYVSGLGIGVSGVESTYNETLFGLNRFDAQLFELIHLPVAGSDLVLTLDPNLQNEAEAALSGKAGAIVVLDGETGAVLAMASSPHYDPNQALDTEYILDAEACGDESDCQGLFINRATQALYPPGSTWKTVTLIAALDSGLVTPETVFDFGDPVKGVNGSYYVYEVDGSQIVDPNHTESKLDLGMSYAKSANAAFAKIGVELTADTLLDYAVRLGFTGEGSQRFPLEVERSVSRVAKDTGELQSSAWLRAVTGIGQGELLVTPLDMARVVLAVINHGNIPLPYIVETIRYPLGGSSDGPFKGRVITGVMSENTADEVQQMMIETVESGSGGQAAVSGLTVGGKTGTAQLDGNVSPHAWFIGFAQDGNRTIAAAIIIENGGEGSRVAAPIFARMAQAAFDH